MRKVAYTPLTAAQRRANKLHVRRHTAGRRIMVPVRDTVGVVVAYVRISQAESMRLIDTVAEYGHMVQVTNPQYDPDTAFLYIERPRGVVYAHTNFDGE